LKKIWKVKWAKAISLLILLLTLESVQIQGEAGRGRFDSQTKCALERSIPVIDLTFVSKYYNDFECFYIDLVVYYLFLPQTLTHQQEISYFYMEIQYFGNCFGIILLEICGNWFKKLWEIIITL
jgi:hypothetical protein